MKGITTVQLFDAKTGELQKEIKKENMVTNIIGNMVQNWYNSIPHTSKTILCLF